MTKLIRQACSYIDASFIGIMCILLTLPGSQVYIRLAAKSITKFGDRNSLSCRVRGVFNVY
jgi:hypothetical protein